MTTGASIVAFGTAVLGTERIGSSALAIAAVDPGEARRLLRHELSGRAYDAARPTWWDRLSKGFIDWLGSLRIGGDDSFDRTLLVIAIVVVLAVLVLVVLVYGLPRRRAMQRSAASAVFDDDDHRTAAALRAAADDAARRGDWDSAVLDGFRALARGLAERDLVPDVPGATARTIAEQAVGSFPAHADGLRDAARRFDRVRYADVRATDDDHRAVSTVERGVATSRPTVDRIAVPS
ncbi:DUF4129 domain-containing protein [Curtobacterium sp. RRHDQ10]|uniref:DUF4129 domain-containing protein n=1 Tax=Curtobacterium phyllosphaerae TaxID=3413379 RepID=UPI003BF1B6EC